MLDLLLKGALICDGTGARPFYGDVGIKDGKIAYVSPSVDEEAAERCDVSGLVVSPAFIDIHSHSDDSYLQDDRCQAKIYQGIATELVGQCGSSLFPRTAEQMAGFVQKADQNASDPGYNYQSICFEQLRSKAEGENRRMSTNLVQLVGHNAIRRGVVGLAGRVSTAGENVRSADILEQNLAQGAWGLSLGLGYMPGIFSDMNELVALADVCRKYDALITSHMRYEDHRVFDALEEMIELSRISGARVHIAHLKLETKQMWGKADRLYARIEQAVRDGVRITADMYPYNACSTGITDVLPGWAMEGGGEGILRRITASGADRDRIYQHLLSNYPDKAHGDNVYVVSTYGSYPHADGKTAGQLSEELGLPVPDTLIKILIDTACDASCIFFSMHPDDVEYLLAQDIAIGSDGLARPYDPAMNFGKPHPRSYGAFARFLRLRRQKNLCNLETAIHRITQKPADIIGLTDRGVLKAGYVADIAVFDQETICDTATYDNPFQKPTGIHHVLLGGSFAVRDGEQTTQRLGGYILKKV